MPFNLEQAIIKTVIYADLFDYPLTMEETGRWLIGVRANQAEVNKAVRILIDYKKIESKNNYIYLPGRSGLFGLRIKKNNWSMKKTDKLKKILPLLKKVPFIQIVGITGTLSMKNALENDDIDLLIVTEKNRLWLTRGIITVLLELKGIRRHPLTDKAKDKICINMYLDEDHLPLLKPERDIFSAHELLQMKPIIEKDAVYARFLTGNKWVEKYLPNAFEQLSLKTQKRESLKKNKKINRSVILIKRLIDSLEVLFEWMQVRYMRNRRTNELISSGYVRFHPHDARTKVLSEYRQKLGLFGFHPGDFQT